MTNTKTQDTEQSISPIKSIKMAAPDTAIGTTERTYDTYSIITPQGFHSFERVDSSFLFTAQNQVQLRVDVLSAQIIRFRYAPYGRFERDFSYAIDPKFQAIPTELEVVESMYGINIKTPALFCIISKDDFRVTIYTRSGKLLSRDRHPYRAISTLLHGLAEVRISKTAPKDEIYFGLGDKSCTLNLRGEYKENWNTDAFGYNEERDPLYRSVPFYYGLTSGHAYGIFLDNSYRSHFDFVATAANTTAFYAEGGEMNYYFIYGPELTTVAQQYAKLTGTPELPPLWSLGYHQCRWSYYPERRVRAIAQQFRERQIPCDAIYLDIDYMDGYRCFTWNQNYFPDPKGMIADLAEEGFQTIVMIDPGLRVDKNYEVYQSGLAADAFCKRTSGELMVGPVWPPACVWPDYTKPSARTWWGELYRGLYNEQGVSGFWNDMNEPAMFKVDRATFPDEVLHDYDGDLTNHRKAHNIYGLQMSRATTEGLKNLQPEKRPFLLTRATFSGGQRYAATWTGDNVANWEHLHIANIQCQRLSISGFSFCGSDIGGFVDTPTGELMVRWLQLGIFHPFYRVHSMGNNVDGASEANQEEIAAQERLNRLDQEPWVYGEEYTPHAKAAIELRYQLLGYIYTAFWQHVQLGTPMLKSLAFYDQTDVSTYTQESEFIFGEHLLVCPVEKPCTLAGLMPKALAEDEANDSDDIPATPKIAVETTQQIYLPRGTWYDFHSKQKYEGQQYLTQEVQLRKIPIFVKAGAVLPMYPVQQYVGEKEITEVQLHLFYESGETQSQLYQDAGEGYGYTEELYRLTTFHLKATTDQLTLERTQIGQLKPPQKTYRLFVYGLPFVAQSCQVDGQILSFEQDQAHSPVEVVVPSAFQTVVLS